MLIAEYIDKFYGGNKSAFAQAVGVLPQQVTKWVAMGCVVVNDRLYSPRRDLPKPA